MTTENAIKTSLALLCETFNRTATKVLADAYWTVLSTLTADEIGAATKRALSECKFMPAPAELLAFARRPRDLHAEAAIAWDAIGSALNRPGWNVRSIDFGNHVNACIRQLGGWDALYETKLSEFNTWKRKEFERLYVMLADQPLSHIGRALEGSREAYSDADHHVIAIAGIPSQPSKVPALPPAPNGVAAHIQQLAEEKSL